MRQQQISVGNGSVVVDVHSSGPVPDQRTPLLIIPGVMSDAAAWRPVAQLLATEREVYVMNRRGRPPISDLPTGYSLMMEIDDVQRVLTGMSVPAHVFGWSLGALLALEAVASGANARSLVLYEPVMAPFGQGQVKPLREARQRGDFDAMVEIVNRDISGYDQVHVNGLRRDQESWAKLCRLAMSLADEIRALNRFTPDLQAYGTIETPTTVLYGTESGPVYQVPSQRITQALLHARTKALEGQDHLIHITAPAVLADAINTRLTGS